MELIARANWREAVTYRETWPHEYVVIQKDGQQVAVIRKMNADLNLGVDVVTMPTVREPDGLALSSRNAYLAPEERAAAPVVYRALCAAAFWFAVREQNRFP